MTYRVLALEDLKINSANDRHGELENETAAIAWLFNNREAHTPADEAHFVGVRAKAPILKAFGAHIFFDDQEKHVLGASGVVSAGHVPGPHSPDAPVIPAAV